MKTFDYYINIHCIDLSFSKIFMKRTNITNLRLPLKLCCDPVYVNLILKVD